MCRLRVHVILKMAKQSFERTVREIIAQPWNDRADSSLAPYSLGGHHPTCQVAAIIAEAEGT
jgi:hypothetical protein